MKSIIAPLFCLAAVVGCSTSPGPSSSQSAGGYGLNDLPPADCNVLANEQVAANGTSTSGSARDLPSPNRTPAASTRDLPSAPATGANSSCNPKD